MGKGGQRPPSDADKGLIASEYGCRAPARKIYFTAPSECIVSPRVDVGLRGDGVGPSSPGHDGASDATADSADRIDATERSTPSPRDPHHYHAQGPK